MSARIHKFGVASLLFGIASLLFGIPSLLFGVPILKYGGKYYDKITQIWEFKSLRYHFE